jgi:hypothetical protein
LGERSAAIGLCFSIRSTLSRHGRRVKPFVACPCPARVPEPVRCPAGRPGHLPARHQSAENSRLYVAPSEAASVPVRRAPLRWSVTRTIPTSRQDRCQRLSRWINATMPSPTADLALATPQDQPSRVVHRSSLTACRRPVPRNGPSTSISQKHGRRHAAAHADSVARGSRRAGASDAWLSGVTGGPARVTIQSAVSPQRLRMVESCVPREAIPSDNPCERALGSSDTSQGLLDTLL